MSREIKEGKQYHSTYWERSIKKIESAFNRCREMGFEDRTFFVFDNTDFNSTLKHVVMPRVGLNVDIRKAEKNTTVRIVSLTHSTCSHNKVTRECDSNTSTRTHTHTHTHNRYIPLEFETMMRELHFLPYECRTSHRSSRRIYMDNGTATVSHMTFMLHSEEVVVVGVVRVRQAVSEVTIR